jgi:3-dehydroquinate synthase
MSVINAGSYNVYAGGDVFAHLGDFLSRASFSSIFLLVDENTLDHCVPQLVSSVELLQDAEIIETESGEENKSIEVCVQLWSTLSELGADRSSLLVNLGGGVIGDMGGFVASTFKRGVAFINIPTTLLAQVDASVGGKTGVDLGRLKNEIGVFCDPKAVFIHPAFLNTLDERQLRSGFAEVIKHALIADSNYWSTVKEVDHRNAGHLSMLVPRSVEIKNRIVLDDPREQGRRKALNFGHTIGHAIESLMMGTQSSVLHGEAIAAGMICEAYLSNAASTLAVNEMEEITSLLRRTFPAIKIPKSKDRELLSLMQHDKKNSGGKISFTLLSSIGKCTVDNYCSTELIIESLNYYRNKSRA